MQWLKKRSWVWIPLKPERVNFSIIWGQVHVSANSDLVYFTARFLRPYLLRAGKHLVNALDLKHKKDHLTVKTTKRNKFLSYLKNLESFLVVTSVAMRFFRNAATQPDVLPKTRASWEHMPPTISLASSVLRGRAQKDVFMAVITCSSEKKV